MKNPVLKQRKTRIVSGWLTRNVDGWITLSRQSVDRGDLFKNEDGCWCAFTKEGAVILECWTDDEFKALYTGIPRKGRATYVQIEIVVD